MITKIRFPLFKHQQRAIVLMLGMCSVAGADDVAQLCVGRTAVERVYYNHRLGQKPPFEQASPPALIERLVMMDMRKETVLRKVYNVNISRDQLAAEVQRIQTTTRAPEMLAEIKTALGNDEDRFAVAFAKPFVVDRLLRERFESDDALHDPQRRTSESIRMRLLDQDENGFEARLAVLKENHEGNVQEQVTWQLTPRPADDTPNPQATAAVPTRNTASGGVYQIEATAQVAQTLSSPEHTRREKERECYFEDLPAKLQDLLRVQLQQSGDVSAVIETSGAFQIYLAKERNPSQLSAAVFTIRKRAYEEWLSAQPDS